ncbi:hypothetical protein A6770_09575 [Nostoc minutum NIES-26]|uniref:Uncharacterized protein n=1 Tax=Nostoc minutum NIES-26 TaxID=1844469 RepID=A0A367RXP5_9NOSO|nr:hypothetical protein A6770_09575 [Nostoc minutum NIES-26]
MIVMMLKLVIAIKAPIPIDTPSVLVDFELFILVKFLNFNDSNKHISSSINIYKSRVKLKLK